jgi:hypothetical protein
MSALEFLLNAFSIALGVVFGTVIAWIMSYFLARKMLPSLLRMLYEKRETIEALRALMEKLGVAEGGWILRRDESGKVLQIYREREKPSRSSQA